VFIQRKQSQHQFIYSADHKEAQIKNNISKKFISKILQDLDLPGCEAASMAYRFLIFPRNVVPSSTRSQVKPHAYL
jgi:hypothetical protein